MLNSLRFLFNQASQTDMLREQCLDQMLQVYHEESSSGAVTDDLERELLVKLRILPVLREEKFSMTWEAAILSLRGRLLAFSAAAIMLLSLAVGLKYQSQSPVGFEEVLTYNADPAHRDPFSFLDEMDYGR